MAQCVLPGIHLRAGAPSYLRPVDLFAGASYFDSDLRQRPAVSRLERGLSRLFAEPLGAAPVIRCGVESSAGSAALAGGAGLGSHRRHDSEKDRPPYSGSQDSARPYVAHLPRELLLWSALCAGVRAGKPARCPRTGTRLARALRFCSASQQTQEECAAGRLAEIQSRAEETHPLTGGSGGHRQSACQSGSAARNPPATVDRQWRW
jgi:hypothetical protein